MSSTVFTHDPPPPSLRWQQQPPPSFHPGQWWPPSGPPSPTQTAAGRPWSGPAAPPHLSVQASGHSHDVARFTVDGEHVLGGALRGLRHDPVAHHPVGRGGVICIVGRDCHHVGACNRDRQLLGDLPAIPAADLHTHPGRCLPRSCLPGDWMWCVSFSTCGLGRCQGLGMCPSLPPPPDPPAEPRGWGLLPRFKSALRSLL